MADISDVLDVLVTLAAQAAYPSGTGHPSVAAVPIKLYAGWPTASQLDADLLAGTSHVTVFPRPEERNTTCYIRDWQQIFLNTPTLTLTINLQTVTVSGTIPAANNPHNLSIMANGFSFVYAVQLNDTLTTIATALSTLIAASIPGTTNTGAVITIPAPSRIQAARVGVTGTNQQEIRRQERLFQISIWSDTPAHRDMIAKALDVAMAEMTFINLPDSTAARIRYKNSMVLDNLQKAKLYRRDLFYQVEYATTQTTTATQVIQGQLSISENSLDITQTPVSTITTNF